IHAGSKGHEEAGRKEGRKCQFRSRAFIVVSKNNHNYCQSTPFPGATKSYNIDSANSFVDIRTATPSRVQPQEVSCVAIVQVQELIEAGVHFGHRASRWNPKMRPYIYGKRNLIHIIDLRETVRGLLRAYKFLAKVASNGILVLSVGTKRQAKETSESESGRRGMPYV